MPLACHIGRSSLIPNWPFRLRDATSCGGAPDLGTLASQVEELRSKVDTSRGGTVGVSSLTPAELRLLPLLPTHLSFREIGERPYVSQHTVKAQAMSIYRKLGVSSRSQVDALRAID